MNDADKPREQLIQELVDLRGRLERYETSGVKFPQAEEAVYDVENLYESLEDKPSDDDLSVALDAMARLIQQLPVGIQVFDSSGLCVDVNQAHLDIFGVSREDLVGRYNIFNDPLAKQMSTTLAAERALKGEIVVLGDLEFNFADADVRYASPEQKPRIVNVTLLPIFDSNRQVINVVGVNVDITARKQAEDRLYHSEANLRAMLDSASQSFTMIDREYRVIDTDVKGKKTAESIFGKLMRPGESIFDFVVERDRESFRRYSKIAFEGGTVIVEHEIRDLQGRSTYYEVTYYPVSDKSGEIIGICMGSQNITERKRSEGASLENERLRSSFKKEQEKNALFQRMISALSHDLRTPLAVIASSKEMLSRYGDRYNREQRQEKLDTIGRQLQFVLELLDDLTTLVKGNLSERTFNPVPFHLGKLCQLSINEMQSSSDEHFSFNFINYGDVSVVAVDEVLISRILLNLLSNAVKFSPAGGEIRLELDLQDNGVILRVADQGLGIPEADYEHIFEPFYRASTVEEIPGTGLGLSIVQDCVARHNGHIKMHSQIGSGTTFEVWLPLSVSELPLKVAVS